MTWILLNILRFLAQTGMIWRAHTTTIFGWIIRNISKDSNIKYSYLNLGNVSLLSFQFKLHKNTIPVQTFNSWNRNTKTDSLNWIPTIVVFSSLPPIQTSWTVSFPLYSHLKTKCIYSPFFPKRLNCFKQTHATKRVSEKSK